MSALEPAYRALALTLPGEADIAREIGTNIDPDRIFDAREALIRAIANANVERFAEFVRPLARSMAHSDRMQKAPDGAHCATFFWTIFRVASGDAGLAARQFKPLPI